MSDPNLADLKEMLDRLGLDMWLSLDEPTFEKFFGAGEEALKKAREFAANEGWIFIATSHRSGRFGQPYAKKGR